MTCCRGRGTEVGGGSSEVCFVLGFAIWGFFVVVLENKLTKLQPLSSLGRIEELQRANLG